MFPLLYMFHLGFIQQIFLFKKKCSACYVPVLNYVLFRYKKRLIAYLL